VQTLISDVIRCNPVFIKRKKIQHLTLLNVGCGPFPNKSFINLDYCWTPEIDICWDITRKPYPLKSSSLEGIYTEHCLEHIGLSDFEKNMHEFFRLLKPGGTVRIIMPDGEIYLDIYQKRKNGENIQMPFEKEYISPMARINGIFRNHGHRFIYDFHTVKKLLEKAGFKDIKKKSFSQGRDKHLLIDTESRAIESLYVEASK
jgi:predicted SAM-dependent methyltransferase